ncbi:hypothetical protein BKA82DRAFT_129538 [Pisolithus tinctorius]|uniref:Uncharacterized protein n=1 Tax=Pisolithus tinctorius Marx 270 TaxID=870435 RepID=A0A0C3PPM3_PISTI|nr:hypothetical protein BKA82DRAFT_129538 [Pisolithus tinctorius]KIO10414.1 hypothetical protein M404DRAFT_129538 [Pisolithus tinctorius Marx 270]
MTSVFAKLDVDGDVKTNDASRLTSSYPAAYKDFYGLPSLPPCIYKSGPAWRERTGPEAYRITREARPVYDHPIADQWHAIGTSIYQFLDSKGVKWTSIDPVGFAEEGEVEPFCPLLMWIGVHPKSLVYDAAVAAAEAIKKILTQAGFTGIEVAFRESVVTRSVATGPKLFPFNPLRDPVPELLKPFTPTLGFSIAPLKTPYYEGTGALYLRVGNADKRTVLLTAAHVARPSPTFADTSVSRMHNSQVAEEIVALGDVGYSNAVTDMLSAIGDLSRSIDVWNDNIARLSEQSAEGEEDEEMAEKRQEYVDLVNKAKKKIEKINKLHNDVTKFWATPKQRVIGFVLHVEPIAVGDEPHQFTHDWALVELYEEKISWDSFKGNKVYVGENLSSSDYGKIMFPRPEDQAGYKYPRDGLLQAYGVVKEKEIRSPRYLDANGHKCLLVVKNGMATGTTVGHVNGLYSFTRVYTEDGIEQTSVEVAVLPYDKKRGAFSASGDSGAIVLERGGGIVGMLTGGSGTTEATDTTYLTPYWWLEEQIKKVLPGSYLYDVVQ